MEKIIIPVSKMQNGTFMRVKENFEFEVEKADDVSDCYHTFGELYDHRITLYIALCKTIFAYGIGFPKTLIKKNDIDVWRSKKHSDGSIWDKWFILGIGKNKGEQITYHLPIEKWDECDFAETLDKSPKWDGHTSDDVLKRLKNL